MSALTAGAYDFCQLILPSDPLVRLVCALDAIRVHLPRVVFASPGHLIGLGRSAKFRHFRTYITAHFTHALNPKLTGGCNKP
jgi:hypothetical protein